MFKKLVGISPFDYLRARRLLWAAEQLRDKSGRILDVAFDANTEIEFNGTDVH